MYAEKAFSTYSFLKKKKFSKPRKKVKFCNLRTEKEHFSRTITNVVTTEPEKYHQNQEQDKDIEYHLIVVGDPVDTKESVWGLGRRG